MAQDDKPEQLTEKSFIVSLLVPWSLCRRSVVRGLGSIRFPSESGGAAEPLGFNPVSMENERNNNEVYMEGPSKHRVKFLVTPALYMHGTMNGEFLDNEEARCRAGVVLDGQLMHLCVSECKISVAMEQQLLEYKDSLSHQSMEKECIDNSKKIRIIQTSA